MAKNRNLCTFFDGGACPLVFSLVEHSYWALHMLLSVPPQALYYASMVLWLTGKHDKARDYLEKILKHNPSSKEVREYNIIIHDGCCLNDVAPLGIDSQRMD